MNQREALAAGGGEGREEGQGEVGGKQPRQQPGERV